MNTTETTWIKMSNGVTEIKNGDIVGGYCGASWITQKVHSLFDVKEWLKSGKTHYFRPPSLTLPPPPPRELTQREKDYVAADAYLNKTAFNGGIGYLVTNAHIAGKHDERREILSALDAASLSLRGEVWLKPAAGSAAFAAIRARLEEQGAK